MVANSKKFSKRKQIQIKIKNFLNVSAKEHLKPHELKLNFQIKADKVKIYILEN